MFRPRTEFRFIRAGYVDPTQLVFAAERVTHVHEVAEKRLEGLFHIDAEYGEIYRAHPFHQSPDFVAALRKLLEEREVKELLEE